MGRSLAAALMSVVSAGPAFACSNPMMWALLNSRCPDAKVVFEAELAGRAAGTVQARNYNATPSVSCRLWSMRSLNELAQDIAPGLSAHLADGETLSVLLADELFHSPVCSTVAMKPESTRTPLCFWI